MTTKHALTYTQRSATGRLIATATETFYSMHNLERRVRALQATSDDIKGALDTVIAEANPKMGGTF